MMQAKTGRTDDSFYDTSDYQCQESYKYVKNQLQAAQCHPYRHPSTEYATQSRTYRKHVSIYDNQAPSSTTSSKETISRREEDDDHFQNDGNNIYVGHLSKRTTSDRLHEVFGKYGPLVEATVIINPKNGESRQFGFVKFVSVRDADDAIDGLRGAWIDGACPRIERARRSREHEATPGYYMGQPAKATHPDCDSSSYASISPPYSQPTTPNTHARWTRTHLDDRDYRHYQTDYSNKSSSKYRGRLYADDAYNIYTSKFFSSGNTDDAYRPRGSRGGRLRSDEYESGYEGDIDTDTERRGRMLRERSPVRKFY